MANGDAIDIIELLLLGMDIDQIKAVYSFVDEGFAVAVWNAYLESPKKIAHFLQREYPVNRLSPEDQARHSEINND